MSLSLNDMYRDTGTRFRVYVQSPVLEGFSEPETVWVSSPAGSLGPGPEDDRMVAILPIEKKPYGAKDLPPFLGRCAEAVWPDQDGHFDWIEPSDPGFKCTNMWGTVRRVLDVWELYLGRPIDWHFSELFPQLEMIPYVPWDNAHFGLGFMEFGEGKDDHGVERPYALNFDVLAHEAGHGILFSLVGMPKPHRMNTAYRGFHESASDCVAMISALHFESFLDHALWVTKGNVYTENVMSRIGELSDTRQIRRASNGVKMADVISLETPHTKATGKELHKVAQPMTGAVFDILAGWYTMELAAMGLVSAKHIKAMRAAALTGKLDEFDHRPLLDAYATGHHGFRSALAEARDMMGLRLAHAWSRLDEDNFSYAHVAETFLQVDWEMTGDLYQDRIKRIFRWRGIEPRKGWKPDVAPWV
ncbi:MAG: hypothetical protein AAGD13_08260 [Pseudomonadota bacterium]